MRHHLKAPPTILAGTCSSACGGLYQNVDNPGGVVEHTCSNQGWKPKDDISCGGELLVRPSHAALLPLPTAGPRLFVPSRRLTPSLVAHLPASVELTVDAVFDENTTVAEAKALLEGVEKISGNLTFVNTTFTPEEISDIVASVKNVTDSFIVTGANGGPGSLDLPNLEGVGCQLLILDTLLGDIDMPSLVEAGCALQVSGNPVGPSSCPSQPPH